MVALLIFLLRLLVLPSKPKRGLEAENAALRRQLTILQRNVRSRVRLTNSDRLFFVLRLPTRGSVGRLAINHITICLDFDTPIIPQCVRQGGNALDAVSVRGGGPQIW